MLLVACDPGVKYCAFAVFKDKKLCRVAKMSSSFGKIREFFSGMDGFDLVIEGQYLNLNPRTLIRLVSVRAMIITLAKVEGARNCVVVSPQRWQRTILGVHVRSKREQRKRVSAMVASDIAGVSVKDRDVADAICIGEYRLRVGGVSEEEDL